MAIKDKIPSPEKVKNQPKKFTTEEINIIKSIQKNVSDVTFQLGQIAINKMRIKEQEELLKKELRTLEETEQKTAKKLSSKYGKGRLDLDTGEFIPAE